MTAQVSWLYGNRLHLNHGPIDVILQGWGDPRALTEGYAAVADGFPAILPALCAELPTLRSPDAAAHARLKGPVARSMSAATAPFRPAFITPMAAVAGAVAEEVLRLFLRPGITRAYANNGGDIALHLDPGESLTCAITPHPGSPGHLPARVTIRHDDPVRGIATSGWRGRSHSLGIADAVTVRARTAAMADAAATMVANAVDLPGHPAITRRPAWDLSPDSDLGQRAVTTAVGPLTTAEIRGALDAGESAARTFRRKGLIEAAALFLHPETRTLGPVVPNVPQPEPALA